MDKYFLVRREGKIEGPFEEQFLISMVKQGKLLPTDELAESQDGPWEIAKTHPVVIAAKPKKKNTIKVDEYKILTRKASEGCYEIRYWCPRCSTTIIIDEEEALKDYRCPACGIPTTIVDEAFAEIEADRSARLKVKRDKEEREIERQRDEQERRRKIEEQKELAAVEKRRLDAERKKLTEERKKQATQLASKAIDTGAKAISSGGVAAASAFNVVMKSINKHPKVLTVNDLTIIASERIAGGNEVRFVCPRCKRTACVTEEEAKADVTCSSCKCILAFPNAFFEQLGRERKLRVAGPGSVRQSGNEGDSGGLAQMSLDQTVSADESVGIRESFCGNCGEAVRPDAPACLSCGVPPCVGNEFCRHCGKPVPNKQAIICVQCGGPLASPPQTVQSRSVELTTTAYTATPLEIHDAIQKSFFLRKYPDFYRRAFEEISGNGGRFTPSWHWGAYFLGPLAYFVMGLPAKGVIYLSIYFAALFALADYSAVLIVPLVLPIGCSVMFNYDLYLKKVKGVDFW
jgi:hypothetical protein